MVLVGRSWNSMNSRTRELSEFSAGKYSIGIGLPELKDNQQLRDNKKKLKYNTKTDHKPIPHPTLYHPSVILKKFKSSVS